MGRRGLGRCGMNDVPPLWDPSNPYNTEGISDEDHAIIKFLVDSGVPCVVTCTTDHPVLANSGNVSRHVMAGTNGKGLGVDARGTRAGDDDQLLVIFYAMLRVEGALHELILSHPAVTFNIKNGRRVPPYASADHKDHVHMSVDRGTFIYFYKITKNTEKDGDMPKDKDYVDAAPCWKDGCEGAFSLQFDGGVQEQGDHGGEDHFKGSYFSLDVTVRNDPDRRFYSITVVEDKGYIILGTDGSYYTFE